MLALTILPFSVVAISQKKKKIFTSISSPNSLFCLEIEAISKKKGLHFDFVSEFAILSRNRGSIEIIKGNGMSS